MVMPLVVGADEILGDEVGVAVVGTGVNGVGTGVNGVGAAVVSV